MCLAQSFLLKTFPLNLITFGILQVLCKQLSQAAATATGAPASGVGEVAVGIREAPTSSPIRSLKMNYSTISTNSTTATAVDNDLLCNNDSEFVCICQHNTGNLLQHYVLCNRLIEMDELPIIEMNIRRVNLSARLHTNETYESYFKRRVATAVSNYCEQQADECLATTLRLKKENVVLLSVKLNEDQSTTVGFVITKSQRRTMLDAETILDSTKVKYILSAQLASLSRVLGGVRIERVEMATLGRYDTDDGAILRDNTRLLIILSIVATFLIVTYTIAAVRVCRDCWARRRAKKTATTLNKANEKPNYGTYSTGKQRDIVTGSESRNATTVKAHENAQYTYEQSSPGQGTVVDAYRMRRMFQCDPSQLPAEDVFTLSQRSNEMVLQGWKSLPRAVESSLCQPEPGMTSETRKAEEKENLILASPKSDEMAPENEIFVEIPQKFAKTAEKYEETAGKPHNFKPILTKNSPSTVQNHYNEQVTPVTEPTDSVWRQPVIAESFEPAWEQSTILEPLDSTWNQPTTTDQPAWLIERHSTDSPYYPSNSFSESSVDGAEHFDEEMITLELHAAHQETDNEITPGTAYLKRVSLTNQPNYYTKNPESAQFLEQDLETVKFIPKSRTAHQLEHWSSESDEGESDAYHKLSEVEDDSESTGPEAPPAKNSENYNKNPEDGMEMNLQSSTYTGQFTRDSDERYYERLQESPVTPNSFNLSSTFDELTPQQLINSTSTDDLK